MRRWRFARKESEARLDRVVDLLKEIGIGEETEALSCRCWCGNDQVVELADSLRDAGFQVRGRPASAEIMQ
jgi:hypothetical protein